MNKEIKFRAWDKWDEKMYNNIETSRVELWQLNDPRYSTRNKYMQYTGLKDKNGKDIYESDIVLVDGRRKVVVEYGIQEHEGNYGDIFRYMGWNLTVAQGYAKIIETEFEVIGNVYENPELLEGGGK